MPRTLPSTNHTVELTAVELVVVGRGLADGGDLARAGHAASQLLRKSIVGMADAPRLFFLRDVALQARLVRFSTLLLGSHIGLIAVTSEATPIEVGVGAHVAFPFVVLVEQIRIDVRAAKLLVRFLQVFLIVRTIRSLRCRRIPGQAGKDQQ